MQEDPPYNYRRYEIEDERPDDDTDHQGGGRDGVIALVPVALAVAGFLACAYACSRTEEPLRPVSSTPVYGGQGFENLQAIRVR